MNRLAIVVALCAALSVGGCETAEGPRMPLPSQNIAHPPAGDGVRVVFFNTSNRALFFESGWIRIRIDGRTVPTLWLDE